MDIVLPRSQRTEKCLAVNTSGGCSVLATSCSSLLSILQGSTLVGFIRLSSSVVSLTYGAVQSEAADQLQADTTGCVVCTTACGATWCIPEHQLQPATLQSGTHSREAAVATKSRKRPSSPLPSTAERKKSRRSGSAPLANVNEDVFSSLLAPVGSGDPSEDRDGRGDLPCFWDVVNPVRDCPARYRVAVTSGAYYSLLSAPHHLTIFSTSPQRSVVECYPIHYHPEREFVIGMIAGRALLHSVRSDTELPTVTQCLFVSASKLPNAEQVSHDFVLLISQGLLAPTANTEDVYMVIALDNGHVLGYGLRALCQSPAPSSAARLLQGRLLLDCLDGIAGMFLVTLAGSRRTAGDSLAVVSRSGAMLLIAPVPVGNSGVKQVLCQDSVEGPVHHCCTMQSATGNGTELRDVIVAVGSAAVVFIALPTLTELAQGLSKPLARQVASRGEVRCVWSHGAVPGVCQCRHASGMVTEVVCSLYTTPTTALHIRDATPQSDRMQSVLARLQGVAQDISDLQATNSSLDASLTLVNQSLHFLKSVCAGLPKFLDSDTLSPLKITTHPCTTNGSSPHPMSWVECCALNCTKRPLPLAFSLVADVSYSSMTCSGLPSWSMTIPLAHLAPGSARRVSIPILSEHVTCCTVHFRLYVCVDMECLLKQLPLAAPAAASWPRSIMGFMRSAEWDVLSFCKPAPPEAGLTTQSALLPVRMMNEIHAVSHISKSTSSSSSSSEPSIGTNDILASVSNSEVRQLKSLSVHVPASSNDVRRILVELFDLQFPPDERTALPVPGVEKAWLDVTDFSQSVVEHYSAATTSSSSPALCDLCRGAVATDTDCHMVRLTLLSYSHTLLSSLHAALCLHFQSNLRLSPAQCCRRSLAVSTATRQLKDLHMRMQALRDSFTDFKSLISSSQSRDAGSAGITRPVARRAAAFRQSMWQVYADVVSFPSTQCIM